MKRREGHVPFNIYLSHGFEHSTCFLVQAVQAHVSKCFDNIRRLEFGDDAHSADIIGMVSGEGEHVAFSKPLKARGSVDAWLAAVENSMVSSLRKIARAAFQSYPVQVTLPLELAWSCMYMFKGLVSWTCLNSHCVLDLHLGRCSRGGHTGPQKLVYG
jgi:hypothetical protein